MKKKHINFHSKFKAPMVLAAICKCGHFGRIMASKGQKIPRCNDLVKCQYCGRQDFFGMCSGILLFLRSHV